MGYRPTGGFKEAPFESTFHAQFPSRFKFPRAPSPCAWALFFGGGSLSHVLCARPTREGWTGVWPRKQILDETKRLKTNRGRRSPIFGNAWTSCLVTPRLVNKRGVYYDPPRFPPRPASSLARQTVRMYFACSVHQRILYGGTNGSNFIFDIFGNIKFVSTFSKLICDANHFKHQFSIVSIISRHIQLYIERLQIIWTYFQSFLYYMFYRKVVRLVATLRGRKTYYFFYKIRCFKYFAIVFHMFVYYKI